MFLIRTTTAVVITSSTKSFTTTAFSTPPLFLSSKSSLSFSKPLFKFNPTKPTNHYSSSTRMSWLNKLGFGTRPSTESSMDSTIPQGPDDDKPAPGQQFAQFGAGCFWGVELAFQRVPGVTKTEVGYTQGFLHNPTYEDVCSGATNHSEVVRVQYDPKECTYESLLDAFWDRHDPTTLNRQIENQMDDDRCTRTQLNHGIYFYTPEQEALALESKKLQQSILNRVIVTEILPAKKFYRAEGYHQQYLAKGGRFGLRQSTEKGCNDPIRCYG